MSEDLCLDRDCGIDALRAELAAVRAERDLFHEERNRVFSENAELRVALDEQQAAGEALAEALRYADSVMWMAKEYAEAGGSGGPEMRDFEPLPKKVEAALARWAEVAR